MRSHILVALVALIVVAQACCCCTLLGGPQPPYPITPSDEAVQRFDERMNSLTTNPDGSFTFTVTDEEITSLVVQQLAEQGVPSPISNPQVYFRNGRIEVYGTLSLSGSFSVPGMAALSIAVQDGKPVVTVEEIDAGPIPAPSALLDELTNQINQTLADSFAGGGAEFTITDVQIGEGQMAVTGKTTSGD
jgi:hypothetical protein